MEREPLIAGGGAGQNGRSGGGGIYRTVSGQSLPGELRMRTADRAGAYHGIPAAEADLSQSPDRMLSPDELRSALLREKRSQQAGSRSTSTVFIEAPVVMPERGGGGPVMWPTAAAVTAISSSPAERRLGSLSTTPA